MGHMGHEASPAAALGLYKPRRPQASSLFRLVSDHVRRLQTVYDERIRAAKAVTYRADKSEGPTAGTETADPLAFLARVLVHIPDKGQVTTRYSGWYANRPRGLRRQAEPAAADAPVPMVVAPKLAPTEATRRWAALLRQIYEVDPLMCPRCAGPMRIVACITQSAVIDQILMHLRTRADSGIRPGARSPPSTAACLGLPRPHETNSSDAMKHFFRWIRFRRAVRLS